MRKFLDAGRPGFYCRVVEEGLIEAGQEIRFVERAEGQPTIAEVNERFRAR